MQRLLIVFAALVLLQVAPALAVAASPAVSSPIISATPDPATNPVLAGFQKMGAKFYYLGKNAGLDGWFIVKDGQVQILYSTPDNKAALLGALFGANGDNITITQIARLVQSNKEVADLIASAQKEQAAIAQVGSPLPAAPAAGLGAAGLPTETLSPGERLIHDLSGASNVVIGPNASSPEILMVMDPNCPRCQATWKILREIVLKGSLHLRMIPIGTPDSEDERAAAVLLGSSDATNAWDKYVAGDKTQLAGTPKAAALVAVRANHIVIDNWKIQKTPYLVYRAKDGKVKVVEGEPSALPPVLGDLGL